jgi:hypothetical protein
MLITEPALTNLLESRQADHCEAKLHAEHSAEPGTKDRTKE